MFPFGYEPGVYLGMRDEVYHADPALGSTDLRTLKRAPHEFHAYWTGNPNRMDDHDTEARAFGRALHLLVLQGQAALEREFALEPDKDACLVTIEDLREFLKAHGLDSKGTRKDDLIERVLAHFPKTQIYDRIVAAAKKAGKRIIKSEQWKRIQLASAHIVKNPHLERSFQGGHGEVSVFWEVEGIRYKARFDYLRVIAVSQGVRTAVITDLKSFHAQSDMPIDFLIDRMCMRYLLQPAHYLEALKELRSLVKQGLYDVRDEEEEAWLKRVAQSNQGAFGFVFYPSSGPPYAVARLISPDNPAMDTARREIGTAIDVFRHKLELFGVEGPWIEDQPPREFSMDDLNPGWGQTW